MFAPLRSDRRARGPVTRHDRQGEGRRQDRESGQAITEFAIIMFPLLLLVAGVIQFGIGLNFWLDENRIANQGARWAVVNQWPGCPRNAAAGSCTAAPACDDAGRPAMTNISLVNHLECQAISNGLRDSIIGGGVSICYPPDGDASLDPGDVGSPVRVRLATDFDFVPIVGIGTLTLRGEATMRLEQDPTHLNIPRVEGC
jgi:hypothetical protein